MSQESSHYPVPLTAAHSHQRYSHDASRQGPCVDQGFSNASRMAFAKPSSLLSRFAAEVGLRSLLDSPRDTKLLCLQRFVRLFAYGASTLILALYLSSVGTSDARIGLFMTLTLLGDVAISFLLTLVADRLGRRNVLLLGAALMMGSGIMFTASGNYWVLLAASILGVISPSGNEIGPFKAIEESTLSQLSPADIRSDIFTWYTLLGTAGTASGTIVSGWIVEALIAHAKWSDVGAYRAIFALYAVLGLVKLGLSILLTSNCEAKPPMQKYEQVLEMDDNDADVSSLLSDEADERTVRPRHQPSVLKSNRSWLPSISRQSRITLIKLSLLFSLDSFASGLVPQSLLTYFFTIKFSLPQGTLGTLFFTSNIIAATGMLLAASIAKRIGLIKTMVFTHLPSAIFLALIPLPPRLWLAVLFLLVRASMQSMDQAPRQAFLAAAVRDEERTAVMGWINVVKTAAQSGGPVVTGRLAGEGRFWIAFVVAGGLKVMYDLGLLWSFLGFRGKRDEKGQQRETRLGSRSGGRL